MVQIPGQKKAIGWSTWHLSDPSGAAAVSQSSPLSSDKRTGLVRTLAPGKLVKGGQKPAAACVTSPQI